MKEHVEAKLGESKTSTDSGSYRYRSDFGRRPPPRPGPSSGTQAEGDGRFRNVRQSGNLPSRKLLFSIVGLSFVLPLFVAVALGGAWLRQSLKPLAEELSRARDQLSVESAGTTLRTHALHSAQSVDAFFLERLLDAKSLASMPSVVSATRRAGQEHAARGYGGMNAGQIEASLGSVRSLGMFPEVDLYLLHHLASNPFFLEATVTDRFGFNVAMTHSAPGFVQRDEQWWEDAWKTGLHVGAVEYDRRTGELSTVVGLPIEDPVSGERQGVLKVLLGMNQMQSLVDSTVKSEPGIAISVFVPGGKAVADTESRHAPRRIMSASHGPVAVPRDTRTGIVADEDMLVGYALTAGGSGYLPLRSNFDGLGWMVQVKGHPGRVHPAYRSFDEALAGTRDWPWRAGTVGAAGGLAMLGACLVVVWLLVRRMSRAISKARPDPRRPLPRTVDG